MLRIMKGKRLAAGAAALIMAVTSLGSCGSHIKNNEKVSETSSDSDKDVSAVTELGSGNGTSSGADGSAGGDAAIVDVSGGYYNDTNYEEINVPYIEYNKTYQAESGSFFVNTASIQKDRASFKGDGYVSGAAADNWSLSFDLPESQFYNITVMTASDRALNSTLSVNGRDVWIFRTEGTGSFAEKTLTNIWLEAGINEIRMSSTDNAVDLDYIRIEANKEISMMTTDLSKSTLSNANATWRAEAVYQTLCSNFGRQIITAQHDTPGKSDETNAIQKVTHKYPAIRISDIGGYTKRNPKDITQAFNYSEKGGLIAYDWYWINPAGKKKSTDYEIASVDFDVRKAIPKTIETQITETPEYNEEDLEYDEWGNPIYPDPVTKTVRQLEYPIDQMADWTPGDIEYLYQNGNITRECYLILKDIDTISKKLTQLSDKNIPVIWRPLPVASNGLYWWGLDKEAYKWLWQLMYKRMTRYHGLNNLIWVWSAQNADWYVGDEFCDILSVDVYTEGNRDAQINTMLFLRNICSTKPLAISECGNLPAMESVLREKAVWSYTGLYTEPYLGKELCNDEVFEIKSAAQERITDYYNNNYTLTLDELPSIPDVAKAIRDAAKKDGRAKTKSKEKGSDREMWEDGYYSEEDYNYYDDGSGDDYSGEDETEELVSQEEEDDGYWSDIYY